MTHQAAKEPAMKPTTLSNEEITRCIEAATQEANSLLASRAAEYAAKVDMAASDRDRDVATIFTDTLLSMSRIKWGKPSAPKPTPSPPIVRDGRPCLLMRMSSRGEYSVSALDWVAGTPVDVSREGKIPVDEHIFHTPANVREFADAIHRLMLLEGESYKRRNMPKVQTIAINTPDAGRIFLLRTEDRRKS